MKGKLSHVLVVLATLTGFFPGAIPTLAATPPSVSTVAIGQNGTNAFFTGNLTSLGTAPSVSVSFQWGTVPGNYAFETNPVAMNTTGLFYEGISGLSALTTYYVRAKAVGDGTNYGAEISFRTSIGVWTVPIAVSTTNVVFNLNRAFGIYPNATDYYDQGFDVPAAPPSPLYPNFDAYFPVNPTDPIYYIFRSLEKDFRGIASQVVWKLHVKSDAAIGLLWDTSAVLSSVPLRLTGAGISINMMSTNNVTIAAGTYDLIITAGREPPTVTTNNATDIKTRVVTLNGSLTSLGTATSANVTFLWGLASDNLSFETTPVIKNLAGTFYADLSGLLPGTEYHYRAKAAGDGTAYGEEKIFSTLVPIAPTVTTENATNITSNFATLNGTLTSLGTATSANVSFQWGLSPGNYTFETTPVSMNTIGAFITNLTGLSANTTYYFRAKAVGDGVGYGNEVNFTTSVNLQTVQISLKSGWNMVSLPVTPANTYYKSVFPTALVAYTWDPVTKTYARVTNLEVGKGYMVAVYTDTVATIVGVPVSSWTINITAGWNMIGSVNAAVGITNPEDTPDNSVQKFTYWWTPVNKSYLYGTAIQAGKGYLVAATINCTLTLSTTSK